MTKFFVDDAVIIDAWLIVLHRNREQDERPLRMLVCADLSVIHDIRKELGVLWAAQKGKVAYKVMRDEYLNQRAERESWSVETRNLYASILSTIGNWQRTKGRDKDAQAELQQIWKWAGSLLQFSDFPIQRQFQL